MLSLGGGLPSSDYFPFHQIDVKVPAIGKFTEQETAESGEIISIGKHDATEGKSPFGRLSHKFRGCMNQLAQNGDYRFGNSLELRAGHRICSIAQMDYRAH